MKRNKEWYARSYNYTEIVLSIGRAKQQDGYLSNKEIATAIATGIREDLPYLIKELKFIFKSHK